MHKIGDTMISPVAVASHTQLRVVGIVLLPRHVRIRLHVDPGDLSSKSTLQLLHRHDESLGQCEEDMVRMTDADIES